MPPKDPKAPAGFPQHGDVYAPSDNPAGDDGDPSSDTPPQGDPPKEPKDEIAELRGQVAALTGTINSLQQTILVSRQEAPKPQEPDNFYEKIDERLFQDPKAVLKEIEERAVEKAKKELGASYQKDQGERTFWNEFYQKHPDLRDDDDIVKATLQGQMSKLGALPVSEAITALAGLTRDRISRYSKTPRQRPKVEGASPPSPKAPDPEPPKIVTLSDVIKNRRAKRRGQAA